MTAFPRFSKTALAFLTDLKANNNRDWFAAHKATYDGEIKAPALALGAQLGDALGQITGHFCTPKLFRIYRDVRFSKDKTSYNTHIHMSFAPHMDQAQPPVWMFGLGLDKLSVGVGIFGFDAANLDRFRGQVIGESGDKIAETLQALNADGARVSPPVLKCVPNGYDKLHRHADLLRHKGLSVWYDLDRDTGLSSGVVKETIIYFNRLNPVFVTSAKPRAISL